MKCGDTGRQHRERLGRSSLNAEDRAGPIADVQSPSRSNASPHATPRSSTTSSCLPSRVHAIDGALESARDIQLPIGTDRHRRGVDDARDERLARAGARHAKNRDRRFLTARSAVGDEEIAVGDRRPDCPPDAGQWPTSHRPRRRRSRRQSLRSESVWRPPSRSAGSAMTIRALDAKSDERRLIADGDVGQLCRPESRSLEG